MALTVSFVSCGGRIRSTCINDGVPFPSLWVIGVLTDGAVVAIVGGLRIIPYVPPYRTRLGHRSATLFEVIVTRFTNGITRHRFSTAPFVSATD